MSELCRVEQRRMVSRVRDARADFAQEQRFGRETISERFVVGEGVRHEVRHAGGGKEAAGDTRGEGFSAQPHCGAAAPQGVAQDGVRRVRKRVEREIGNAVAREMRGIRHARCEHQPFCFYTLSLCPFH